MIYKMKLIYILTWSCRGCWSDGVVGIEARDDAGVLLEAVARLLAVGGGVGGGVEALHSAAAWGQGARHMPARDSSMCHGCTHHNHAQQWSQKCNLEASHGKPKKMVRVCVLEFGCLIRA